MDLTTKTYVVTGATSGIGLATAERLARAGAAVIGVGRSPDRCVEVEKRLRLLTRNDSIHYLLANLSVQEEVKSLAAQIIELQASYGKISVDGLVNNAGVFTYWLNLTSDGIELQWAVNHLAPFLLTQLLLPLFRLASFARVVTVSSDSHYSARINWVDPQHRRHYNGLQAYSTTKLANILFTQELNHRLRSCSSVRAFAVDPGLVKTDIGMKETPGLAGWIGNSAGQVGLLRCTRPGDFLPSDRALNSKLTGVVLEEQPPQTFQPHFNGYPMRWQVVDAFGKNVWSQQRGRKLTISRV